MTRRFDAVSYVTAWSTGRRFPAIHNGIMSVVRAEIEPEDGVVLDLCSSTGLLSRQLADVGHYPVVAVEQPGPALQLGMNAGVYDELPVLPLRIARDTLGGLLAWVEERKVTTVVARRCFPELHDALGEEFATMAAGLVDAGVRRVVLEGRIFSARTTHSLGTASREVAALAPRWRGRAHGPFALLTAA
ncbi:hypothetical protein [Saccharothrix hoggarensis]|uniref:Methyltransferase n=1 Tax=Saccharothrix hoggarensis TaxID=913853 RepID=A0ABW3QIC9_9PSEU